MSDRVKWRTAAWVAFSLALFVRFGVVALSRGGLDGRFDYDSGVYYAAADALIHGRLPYHDFVLLHPPGLMLVLTPFAALGLLVSDHTGFVIANVAFATLGSLNAALVVHVARRMGLSLTAGALGGLFYAIWFGAVDAEISVRLEPLSSFVFLCSLLPLLGSSRPTRRALLLAGVALGVTTTIKIWWAAPLFVVLVWQLRSRETRRHVLPLAAGASAAIVLIDAPFFIAAPGAMWRMVVRDQLQRHSIRQSAMRRLDELSSLRAAFPHLSAHTAHVALVLNGVLLAALGLAAWRTASARLLVLLCATQFGVLLTAPSYFLAYSEFLAATLSLVLAAAAHGARRSRLVDLAALSAAAVTVATAAALTAFAVVVRPVRLIQPFPGAALARGVAHVRCVMSDSPMALIELDVLSRDLAEHCPNWVDVTGRTYDRDAPPPGHFIGRAHNAKWQSDLRDYLLDGDATIIIRRSTGLDAATRRLIRHLPLLESAHGVRVYRVPPADRL
jgi:alpha-1,2-mannosyltransferase